MAEHYVGTELDVFAGARNWKAYWSGLVAPLLGRRVLDVGAGIGATAMILDCRRFDRYLALEPDPALVGRMRAAADAAGLPDTFQVRQGSLTSLPAEERFDTILYIDVLEHIEADREELARAARHLEPGGRIVVLSPAHQWLYAPFDAAIGHCRRYDRRSLQALQPEGLAVESVDYLDSVGMLASLGNRLLLRSASPSPGQIALWDNWMVPASRRLDGLFGRRLGKSILAVFRDRRTAVPAGDAS